MKVKGKNIFVNYLNLLGVRYTEAFSDQHFNEHPHKNNLYGLSEMLSTYGIRNAATRIEDKESDLFHIPCPFIAQSGGDFVVVEKVEAKEIGETGEVGETGKIHFIRKGKKLSIPVSQFIQSWSGVTLLAETSPNSAEPDYTEHRKKEILAITQKSILALAGILLLGFAYLNTIFPASPISPVSPIFPILLLVNLIGIYICYLLVLKQLHIQSRYADKICTLFSQSDCNNVLESDAARLWGIFGWSEIGLGYFSANTVILLFLPHLIPYSAIINVLAIPFTVWSVWYQKFKARQWCPLCLIVQILLWCIFIINVAFGYIQIPDFSLHSQFSILNSQFSIPDCRLYLHNPCFRP